MNIKEKMAAFDGFGAGNTATVTIDKFSRLVNGVALECQGDDGAAGLIDASDVIEYVIVEQDTKQKIYIEPDLQRKMDQIENGTDDTLSSNFIFIPFRRLQLPGSAWGAKDIGQLRLRVKLKSSFGANNFNALVGYYAYTPLANPQNRGDVVVHTIINRTDVVAGWNTINDLPYYEILALTRLLLDSNAITEVQIKVGERVVYNLTKDAASFGLQVSPLYKKPTTLDYFPVVLDDLGDAADFIPLFENGTRRNVEVKFYWDTGIAAVSNPLKIYAEGIERGNPQPATNIVA